MATLSYIFTNEGIFFTGLLPTATPNNIPYVRPNSGSSFLFLNEGIFFADTTLPTIQRFDVPDRIITYTVPVTANISLQVTDNIGVTGVMVVVTDGSNNIPQTPLVSDPNWGESVKSSYDFSTSGVYTFTLFVKDAAGNINQQSKNLIVSIFDVTAPIIVNCNLTQNLTNNIIPITLITASDNLSEPNLLYKFSLTPDDVYTTQDIIGWGELPYNVGNGNYSSSSTINFTYPDVDLLKDGSVNNIVLYLYVSDLSGNYDYSPFYTTITYPDISAPTITSFEIVSNSASEVIEIVNISASDLTPPLYYMVTKSDVTNITSNSAGWSLTPPVSFVYPFDEIEPNVAKTISLKLWCKDGSSNRNVSSSISNSCIINKTVSFEIETTSNDAVVKIIKIESSDIQQLKYLVTKSSDVATKDSVGWSSIKSSVFVYPNIPTNISTDVTLKLWCKSPDEKIYSVVSNICSILKPKTDKQDNFNASHVDRYTTTTKVNAISEKSIYYFDISKKGIDILNNKDVPVLTDSNAIRESVINLLSTENETFIYDPEKGVDLNKYIFEPIDEFTAAMIKYEINLSLNKYESRIKDLEVSVVPIEEENTYEINITYKEIFSNSEQTIQIDFKKIR